MRLSFRKNVVTAAFLIVAVTGVPVAADTLFSVNDSGDPQSLHRVNALAAGPTQTNYAPPASPQGGPGCAEKANGNGYAYGCGSTETSPPTTTPPPPPPPPPGPGTPPPTTPPSPLTGSTTQVDSNIRFGCVVYFNLDGGVNAAGNRDMYSYAEPFSLADPVRVGYKFEGWFAGDTKVSNYQCLGSNVVLTAKWTKLVTVTPTPTPTAPAVVKKDYSYVVRIQFTMGSSKLSAAAKDRIGSIVAKIPGKAEGLVVDVTGYVQATKGSKNNAQLSLARARAVVAEFRAQGISAAFTFRGKGVLDKDAASRQAFAKITFRA